MFLFLFWRDNQAMKSERYTEYNANPHGDRVGDCVIRAISKAENASWAETYTAICLKGLELANMPSADVVWSAYLVDKGYSRRLVNDHYLGKYTVSDFCRDNPVGVYILALSGHVVCAIDGRFYDSWDSGNEEPIYYWTKEE